MPPSPSRLVRSLGRGSRRDLGKLSGMILSISDSPILLDSPAWFWRLWGKCFMGERHV